MSSFDSNVEINKGLFDKPLACNKSKFVINNFVIPDEQMPKNPFDGSSRYNIYKLSIPNTVKSIKNYAFDNKFSKFGNM